MTHRTGPGLFRLKHTVKPCPSAFLLFLPTPNRFHYTLWAGGGGGVYPVSTPHPQTHSTGERVSRRVSIKPDRTTPRFSLHRRPAPFPPASPAAAAPHKLRPCSAVGSPTRAAGGSCPCSYSSPLFLTSSPSPPPPDGSRTRTPSPTTPVCGPSTGAGTTSGTASRSWRTVSSVPLSHHHSLRGNGFGPTH